MFYVTVRRALFIPWLAGSGCAKCEENALSGQLESESRSHQTNKLIMNLFVTRPRPTASKAVLLAQILKPENVEAYSKTFLINSF